MFAISLVSRPASVTDGLSNTFMMGEGSQSTRWPARSKIEDTMPALGMAMDGSSGPGAQYPLWGWVFADVHITPDSSAEVPYCVGGPLGTTMMPLNQYPVLQTLAVLDHAFVGMTPTACNSSAHATPAGHKVSGFRSSHPLGRTSCWPTAACDSSRSRSIR